MSSSLVPRLLHCSSNSALGLLSRSSERVTRSLSISVTRLLCSHSQEDPITHAPPQSSFQDQTNPITQQQQLEDDDHDHDDEDGGHHVNKETGEVGGPKGPEPTRYGDWERNGRCYDF